MSAGDGRTERGTAVGALPASVALVALVAVGAGLAMGPAGPVMAEAGLRVADGTRQCAGRDATIVGAGQRNLVGTDGSDVIISGGASSVDAEGGDDVVCVTGRTGYVVADEGDDQVRVEDLTASRLLQVDLGHGADSFVGGDERDHVLTGDGGGSRAYDDVDVVRTGGGVDHVESGAYRVDLVDDIDLGPGDDDVVLAGPALGPGGRLVGGGGSDLMTLRTFDVDDIAGDPDPHVDPAWLVSNADAGGGGHADAGSVRRMTWTGFERFGLGSPARSYAFVGGPASEHVSAEVLDQALMGPGDDVVRTSDSSGWSLGRLDGGPGRDRFQPGYCPGRVTADLATDRYRCDLGGGDRDKTVRLTRIEDLSVVARRAQVHGSRRADRISVQACRATVSGDAGADTLQVVARTYYVDNDLAACTRLNRPRPVQLRGGPGNDVVRGSRQRDVLVGGPGFDRASGRQGVDVCRAERRSGCER